jgi:hypothetical protein
MYALTLIIIILLVLFLVGKAIVYFVEKDKAAEPDIKKSLTLKVPKKKVKTDKELDRERANFSKAQSKARRQGHLRFYFHGEYYPTGLLVTNGGK